LSRSAQQEFAERIEKAVYNRDTAAFAALIDWDHMSDRALDSFSLEGEQRSGIRRRFLSAIHQQGGVPSQIMHSLGQEGTFELLRLHERSGQPYALFRLNSDVGLNYHDYRLAIRDGAAIASDIYIFIAGEHVSETMRRTLVPVVAQINKSWLQKLAKSDRAFIDEFEKFAEINQHLLRGDGPAAMRVYDSMSKELKELKPALIVRHQAASLIGEQELTAAYRAFKEAFPEDDALVLLSIDALLVAGKHDQALESIEYLDRSVGGDPYLNVVRSNVNLLKGDREAARDYIELAIEQDPDILASHWHLLSLMLKLNDHQRVYDALHEMEERFDVEWVDIREIEDYAEFVKSEQGKKWLVEQGFEESE
jgi:tetratricopeptide (TPR) repeat protein